MADDNQHGSIREMAGDAGEPLRQTHWTAHLPDFCNMGVWLRVLLVVNAAGLLAALATNRDIARLPEEFVALAALLEPVLLATLVLSCSARRWLERLPPRHARWMPITLAAVVTAGLIWLYRPLLASDLSPWRASAWAALGAFLVLKWLDLRARAYSPAVAEARLMALTARIRPHFLFNSLNAVLGVIRRDPRRAESALEELSELFRALMRDNRELSPLSNEIALARQYLELEKLRLGERLRIRWGIADCPPDALVPPLMLQPLLENAVYHGIEPGGGEDEIAVHIGRRGDRVVIELTNPVAAVAGHRGGNQMALANIRERLMLYFDLEAELLTREEAGRYVVRIAVPFRRKEQT